MDLAAVRLALREAERRGAIRSWWQDDRHRFIVIPVQGRPARLKPQVVSDYLNRLALAAHPAGAGSLSTAPLGGREQRHPGDPQEPA